LKKTVPIITQKVNSHSYWVKRILVGIRQSAEKRDFILDYIDSVDDAKLSGYKSGFSIIVVGYVADWLKNTLDVLIKKGFAPIIANAWLSPSTQCKTEVVCNGSGWGALENILREYEGKEQISKYCDFPTDSLDREQEIWLYLLKNGEFPCVSPDDEPISYVSGKAWRPLLEKAASRGGNQLWFALLQLGIHYYIFGENEKAKTAWEDSIAACESAWTWRNLALIYKNEYSDINKDGNLHPTYPIFGVRKLMRRLYDIFESRGKTINCHVSDCLCLAGVSFAHSLWLGEYIQYGLVKQGADSVPEGYLRATHSGRNFGLPTEFIVYENKPVWSFEDAFAFSLIHGVLPRPNDAAQPLEQISKIWNIIDSFPISESLWCPYFDVEKIPFKCENPQIKISGYKHMDDCKEEWLLFIANSKTKTIESCDIFGVDGFDITNAYTGELLAQNGGKLSIGLKRFDHYILKVKKIG